MLGESEPCTTAANRLIELINKNKRGSVYLDDVTEAFSVERLNKDFLNGYKTQYKRFVDTLTNTKQHRDYVKKLLGRLVFLQFLQKKRIVEKLHISEEFRSANLKERLYPEIK